jgi:hypothetical protein
VVVPFPAGVESGVVAESGDGALDDPSVSAESVVPVDTLPCDPGRDPEVSESLPQFKGIIGFVCVELSGRFRRGLRRDLAFGRARTRGLSACPSQVFAALTALWSGRPFASTRTWIFDPALPRSTGDGLVMAFLFWP